ncbi:MAG: protein kinase [Acidobacteriota bacterium]|jgi:serine/threonine-protein kinase|nr:protein kinase [Acidobacteriota bacterium]
MGSISPLDDNLTIGNYEIIEKLGGRNSGSVYRGLDPEFGRAVVIRVLRENIAWTPGLEERFRRDYAPSADLKHPNIAAVYEIGKEGAFPYVAMESLGPKNIKRLVDQQVELTVEDKLSMLIQAATGIGHAHQNGVLHLNLSPSKIHVTPDGTTKVRDFNLANLLAQYPPPAAPGEPSAYAAPETAEGKMGGVQADIYSLGAVFYECLTLRRPSWKASGEVHFPEFEQVAEIPPGLWIILKTCLEHNPDDRYRNMGDLVAAAQELIDSLAEDKRLMQTELYSAIEPLRRFAARPDTPPESSLGAHKLLHEIQLLASGESAAHYALLERLLNTLLALYPQYAQDAAATADGEQPASFTEALQPAPPSEGMRSEASDASPEETGDAASGATASDAAPAGEAGGQSAPETAPGREEVLPASGEADPFAEPVMEITVEIEARPEPSGMAAASAETQAQPASAPETGARANFTPMPAESGYSNLSMLMDELIQSHPKLQDIDSNADFEMYAPPWAAVPTAANANPPLTTEAAPAPAPVPTPAAATAPPAAMPAPAPLAPEPDAPAVEPQRIPLALTSTPSAPAPAPDAPQPRPVAAGPEAPEAAASKEPPSQLAKASVSSFQDQLQLVTEKEKAKEQTNQELSSSSSAALPNPDRKRLPKTPLATAGEREGAAKKSMSSWKTGVLIAATIILLIAGIGLVFKLDTEKPEELSETTEAPKEIEFATPPLTPLETTLGTVNHVQEEEVDEPPEIAQAMQRPLDDAGRNRLKKVRGWIESGNLNAAKVELNKLVNLYPGATELAETRKKLRTAEKNALAAKAEEEKRQSQLNQREGEFNKRASAYFTQGQYAQAAQELAKWRSENPNSALARDLSTKVELIQTNLRAYDTFISRRLYQDADAALQIVEQYNPHDPKLETLRRQLEVRRSNAQARLTIERLGAKGDLLMDGKTIGSNGEVSNLSIGIGPHTISIESNGKVVASQTINFADTQQEAMVYDVAQRILRKKNEGDREPINRRRQLEQGIPFDVEHPHGTWRGNCKGTLVITDTTITFSSLNGEHSFSTPTGQTKIGAINNKDKSLELLDSDNKKIEPLKFKNANDLQNFRKTLEEVAARR